MNEGEKPGKAAARGEHRNRDPAELVEALARRVDDLAFLPDQLVGLPAEHLGELRIAEEELAVAGERNPD